jgi:hypothetical protein
LRKRRHVGHVAPSRPADFRADDFRAASALSFAYLPFVKINGLPLVAYRMPPKAIIKGLQKPLGLKMRFETFRNPAAGCAAA